MRTFVIMSSTSQKTQEWGRYHVTPLLGETEAEMRERALRLARYDDAQLSTMAAMSDALFGPLRVTARREVPELWIAESSDAR